MLKLFASYKKAKHALDAARADTLPIELNFTVDDETQSVRMTLQMADLDDATPFAERTFTADEFVAFVAQLEVMRERLGHNPQA